MAALFSFFKRTMIFQTTTSGADKSFQDKIQQLPELDAEPDLQREITSFLSRNKRRIGCNHTLPIWIAHISINYQRHSWRLQRHWLLRLFDVKCWSPLGAVETFGCMLLAACYLFITVGANIAAYFLGMIAFNVASFANRVLLVLECYAALKFGKLDATVLWMLVVDRGLFNVYLNADFSALAAHPENAYTAKDVAYKRKVILTNFGIQLVVIFGVRFFFFMCGRCRRFSKKLPQNVQNEAASLYRKNKAHIASIDYKPRPAMAPKTCTPSPPCKKLSPFQRVQSQNMRTWFLRRGNVLLDMTSEDYRKEEKALWKVATLKETMVKGIFVAFTTAISIWLCVCFEIDPILFSGTVCASALMVIDLLLRACDDATDIQDAVDYFLRQSLNAMIMLPLATTMYVFHKRGKVLMDNKAARYGFAFGQVVLILIANVVTDFILKLAERMGLISEEETEVAPSSGLDIKNVLPSLEL